MTSSRAFDVLAEAFSSSEWVSFANRETRPAFLPLHTLDTFVLAARDLLVLPPL
jgi:hypothetical protein